MDKDPHDDPEIDNKTEQLIDEQIKEYEANDRIGKEKGTCAFELLAYIADRSDLLVPDEDMDEQLTQQEIDALNDLSADKKRDRSRDR